MYFTLPPLPSLESVSAESDPADLMLAMARAIGGCYQLPGEHDRMNWIVPLADGGMRRFPAPVGARLVAQGLLHRHPGDKPGVDKALVRFVPRELLPADFQFSVREGVTANHWRRGSIAKNLTEEEYKARQRAWERNWKQRHRAALVAEVMP
ncbi:MAG TPA: hypothetical protein VHA37_07770 [Candidatus Saccharimonadales bacterium]|nr:hypothetical protein [Candidatus Saccharimonadales bacterium]